MASYPTDRNYRYSYNNARPLYDTEKGTYLPSSEPPPPKKRFGDMSHLDQTARTKLYCGVACCVLVLAAIIALIVILVLANGVGYEYNRDRYGYGGNYAGGYGGYGGYGGGVYGYGRGYGKK